MRVSGRRGEEGGGPSGPVLQRAEASGSPAKATLETAQVGARAQPERRAGVRRHLGEPQLEGGHFASDLSRLSVSFIKTEGDAPPARRDLVYLRSLPSPNGT